jgi:hypothetical protein
MLERTALWRVGRLAAFCSQGPQVEPNLGTTHGETLHQDPGVCDPRNGRPGSGQVRNVKLRAILSRLALRAPAATHPRRRGLPRRG